MEPGDEATSFVLHLYSVSDCRMKLCPINLFQALVCCIVNHPTGGEVTPRGGYSSS